MFTHSIINSILLGPITSNESSASPRHCPQLPTEINRISKTRFISKNSFCGNLENIMTTNSTTITSKKNFPLHKKDNSNWVHPIMSLQENCFWIRKNTTTTVQLKNVKLINVIAKQKHAKLFLILNNLLDLLFIIRNQESKKWY